MSNAQKAIERFVGNPPDSAVLLRVQTSSMGGNQTILELHKNQIEGKTDLLDQVLGACQAWSEGAARECLFIGQWLGELDKPQLTLQWRLAPESGEGAKKWNGSLEGLIEHLMGRDHMKDRLFLELLKMSFENSQVVLNQLHERNIHLEKIRLDTEELREELVKAAAGEADDGQSAQNFGRLVALAEKVLLAKNPTE